MILNLSFSREALIWISLLVQMVCLQWGRPGFDPWVREIFWRREWLPSPVFLPGEFHGQRSLVGSSRYSCKESDMTEWLLLLLSRFSRVQLCVTPIDGSPPGYSVPGILPTRILERVAISFSNACMHAKSVQLCPTLCDPMDSSPPSSSVHGIL